MGDGRLVVLLVEDDVDAAAIVAGQLRFSHSDTDVEHVSTLAAACSHLEAARDGVRSPIDVVLLDLGLPDVSPSEPLQALRRILALEDVPPVVVLTGWGASLGAEAMALGAQDYVDKRDATKPHALHRWLCHAVERAARSRGQERQRVQLLRRNEQLRHFAASIAHDLRGTVAKGAIAIDTVRNPRFGPLTDQQVELLDMAARAVQQMAEHVEVILDGVQSAVADERDLVDVRVETATVLGRLAEADRLKLEIDAEVPLPARRGPVQQMLQNLLGNALQHNPGRRVRVRVSTEVTAHDVRLVVEDDGIGIPPSERVQVLRMGVSTGSGRGRGMGLATVSLAANALGGSTHVEPGLVLGGARIVVSLPPAVASPASAGEVMDLRMPA